jgi:phenylpropionate dioxygenase-like ring-hydroxylating dioxygenase large terminal subunit
MLEDYWYIACQSKELKGKPYKKQIMGRNIVLYRAADGKPVALEDRCAHRNSPLSDGKVCGDNLQCPYHGWCFDNQGNITHIPSMPTTTNKPAGIHAYQCIEKQNYIWLCLSLTPEQSTPQTLFDPEESGWSSFRMKTLFTSTVEACLENFLDCPHATYVHKGWFRSPTNKKVKATIRTLSDGAEVEYFKEPREKSIVWSLLSPSRAGMKHTDRFIAPSTSKVDYQFNNGMHYVITSSCTPVNDRFTDVYTVIAFKTKVPGWLLKLYFKPLSKLIIKQDVEVLKSQQNNIREFGKARFTVAETDLLYNHIKSWRTSIKDDSQKPVADTKTDAEIFL